jgi:GNAT superfamily N-acetyltransferase
MCDEWMDGLQLPLTIEQFHRLPRNAAYKYEYLDGAAYLSPRPKFFHALLDLPPLADQPLPNAAAVGLRPLRTGDWDELATLFSAAFRAVVPFGGLEDGPRRNAARKSLHFTRDGGDGPRIDRASFVAEDGENARPVGALLTTLLPDEDPSDWRAFHWKDPPPADCLERRLGRPHLTWVFVSPLETGRGVATALLNAAVRELLAMGYDRLASTFLLGNDASLLWHWRCGFRLASYPGSRRKMEMTLSRLPANPSDAASAPEPGG